MIITFTVAALVLVLFYFLYINLIRKKNNLLEARSGIDVQFKKRYDLIPNILTMAAKFMDHEKMLMEEVTKMRTEAMSTPWERDSRRKLELENALSGKMNELLLSVENYPDLKSNQTMMQAMQTFAEVEEHLAAARRFYNSSVSEFRNAVEIFPGNVVAALIGLKTDAPFFEAEDAARKAIDSKDYFKS